MRPSQQPDRSSFLSAQVRWTKKLTAIIAKTGFGAAAVETARQTEWQHPGCFTGRYPVHAPARRPNQRKTENIRKPYASSTS
jgi:hypothetical protein